MLESIILLAGLAVGWLIVRAVIGSRRRQLDDTAGLRLFLGGDREPMSPPVSPRVRLSNDVPTLPVDYKPIRRPARTMSHERLLQLAKENPPPPEWIADGEDIPFIPAVPVTATSDSAHEATAAQGQPSSEPLSIAEASPAVLDGHEACSARGPSPIHFLHEGQ